MRKSSGAVERELYRHAATLIQHRGDNAAYFRAVLW
jgi:hypothetical protein